MKSGTGYPSGRGPFCRTRGGFRRSGNCQLGGGDIVSTFEGSVFCSSIGEDGYRSQELENSPLGGSFHRRF